MLQLTKRTEYGLIALVHMAGRGTCPTVDGLGASGAHGIPALDAGPGNVPSGVPGDQFVSGREISERYSVPRRLVGEALKDLTRAGLVISQRGATGGYSLAHPAEEISLGQIVAALEGQPTLASCESLSPSRGGECDIERLCPIRSPIHRIRERIWQLMERTTLRAIARYPNSILGDTTPGIPLDTNGLLAPGLDASDSLLADPFTSATDPNRA